MSEQGISASYPDSPQQAKMPERKIIEHLCDALVQEIGHVEKAIVTLTDRLTGVLAQDYPGPTEPRDVKFPGGDSPLAHKLQEFCLRVESIGDNINNIRSRVEL
jgi:hypothetical protein